MVKTKDDLEKDKLVAEIANLENTLGLYGFVRAVTPFAMAIVAGGWRPHV